MTVEGAGLSVEGAGTGCGGPPGLAVEGSGVGCGGLAVDCGGCGTDCGGCGDWLWRAPGLIVEATEGTRGGGPGHGTTWGRSC